MSENPIINRELFDSIQLDESQNDTSLLSKHQNDNFNNNVEICEENIKFKSSSSDSDCLYIVTSNTKRNIKTGKTIKSSDTIKINKIGS